MLLFDEALRKVEYTFIFTGLPLIRRNDRYMNRAKVINFIHVFSYGIDMVAAYWFFINGVQTGQSFISLTYSSPCLTIGLLCYIKAIAWTFNYNYVEKVMSILRDLEVRSNLKYDQYEDIKESIDFLHLVLKVLNYCNWVFIFAFPLMPVSLTAYKYFALNEVDLLLPFYVLYPIDAYNIKYWPFVVVKQIWSGK